MECKASTHAKNTTNVRELKTICDPPRGSAPKHRYDKCNQQLPLIPPPRLLRLENRKRRQRRPLISPAAALLAMLTAFRAGRQRRDADTNTGAALVQLASMIAAFGVRHVCSRSETRPRLHT